MTDLSAAAVQSFFSEAARLEGFIVIHHTTKRAFTQETIFVSTLLD